MPQGHRRRWPGIVQFDRVQVKSWSPGLMEALTQWAFALKCSKPTLIASFAAEFHELIPLCNSLEDGLNAANAARGHLAELPINRSQRVAAQHGLAPMDATVKPRRYRAD